LHRTPGDRDHIAQADRKCNEKTATPSIPVFVQIRELIPATMTATKSMVEDYLR
jgi:hypothetical protein